MGGDNYLLAVTVCRSVDMHIDYVGLHQLLHDANSWHCLNIQLAKFDVSSVMAKSEVQ